MRRTVLSSTAPTSHRRLRVGRATLTAQGGVALHRDGDPGAESDRIELELAPRALTVVAPSAALADPAGPFAAGAVS